MTSTLNLLYQTLRIIPQGITSRKLIQRACFTFVTEAKTAYRLPSLAVWRVSSGGTFSPQWRIVKSTISLQKRVLIMQSDRFAIWYATCGTWGQLEDMERAWPDSTSAIGGFLDALMAVTTMEGAPLSDSQSAQQKLALSPGKGAASPCGQCSLASPPGDQQRCSEEPECCWAAEPASCNGHLVAASFFGFVLPLLLIMLVVAGFQTTASQAIAGIAVACLWVGVLQSHMFVGKWVRRHRWN